MIDVKHLALVVILLAGSATAQIFGTVHGFAATSGTEGGSGANADGAYPLGGLAVVGGALYGTAQDGGSNGYGNVYAVNTDGTGFRSLHNFSAEVTNSQGYRVNVDGAYPCAGLVSSGAYLYGTTEYGGSAGSGVVFRIQTNGEGFIVIKNFYSFSGDGSFPVGPLILSGSTLYGTTYAGGHSYEGTVFELSTNGGGYHVIYSFTATDGSAYTNRDGANPVAALTLWGDILYGTAENGGDSGDGTVFKVNTAGTAYTTLHSFTPASYDVYAGLFENADGIYPAGGVVLSGGLLYGTANQGGEGGGGVVFSENTNGGNFAVLHNFTGNNDGAYLDGSLILSGGVLYGTATRSDQGYGYGTVFAVNTVSDGFATLYDFGAGDYGGTPDAGVVISGSTLYGPAETGGSSGYGTLFRLALRAPQLTFTPAGGNIVLTWPTNTEGFTLESATNLDAAAAWNPVSVAPVVVNGQYVVTNLMTSVAQFFQLQQ
jgi:uncharacterized repeat protein (TIGR03803 family)